MSKNEQPIVDFYAGTGRDSEGRRLDEILGWDDNQLEAVHDYIQWLFPLQERSRFNPDAPLLDAASIAAFQADPQLRARLQTAFERMLKFYGFEYDANGAIVPAANWEIRRRNWLTPYNHNFLRISRILTSLRLLGLDEQSQKFYQALQQVYQSAGNVIGSETFRYWTQASQSS